MCAARACGGIARSTYGIGYDLYAIARILRRVHSSPALEPLSVSKRCTRVDSDRIMHIGTSYESRYVV